jgi:hypothetical protein
LVEEEEEEVGKRGEELDELLDLRFRPGWW